MKKYIYIMVFFILYGCIRKNDQSTDLPDIDLKTKNQGLIPNNFLDFKGKSYTWDEIERWDGVFLIISTTCGECYNYFNVANRISLENKDVKCIALLIDPFTSLKEYKKGIIYKSFGFLNDDWTVFSSPDLIKRLNEDYDLDKSSTPFIFFRKNKKTISQENGPKDYDSITPFFK